MYVCMYVCMYIYTDFKKKFLYYYQVKKFLSYILSKQSYSVAVISIIVTFI